MSFLALATVVLAPVILFIAALAHWIASWCGWIPAGVPPWLSVPLIAFLGLGGLYLLAAVEAFGISPARAQREMLGAVHGSPLTLTGYEFSGFQDPGEEWRYRLHPNAIAELRKRCVEWRQQHNGPSCVLFSEQTDRRYRDATVDGNELVLRDWSL